MELLQANLGDLSKARFLEATSEKKATLYVSVVEQKRVKNDANEWVDGDQVWYDATFTGRDAEWVRDTLQNGDPLLIWGRTDSRPREVDGQTYTSTRVYVDNVSVNPRLRDITVDRSQRKTAARTQAQAPAQQAEQGAAADAEAGPARQADYRGEFGTRLGQVFNQRHIDEATGDRLLAVWDRPDGTPEQKKREISDIVAGYGAAPAVAVYLGSVVDAQAGTGAPLSWNEAAQQAMSAASAPSPAASVPADPWAAVSEIRREVGAPAAAGPGM